jgi:hypothetical protein
MLSFFVLQYVATEMLKTEQNKSKPLKQNHTSKSKKTMNENLSRI